MTEQQAPKLLNSGIFKVTERIAASRLPLQAFVLEWNVVSSVCKSVDLAVSGYTVYNTYFAFTLRVAKMKKRKIRRPGTCLLTKIKTICIYFV
jgi:hypothetical protein